MGSSIWFVTVTTRLDKVKRVGKALFMEGKGKMGRGKAVEKQETGRGERCRLQT